MQSARARWGSLLFTVVVPGTVAGLVPFLISRWRIEHDLHPEGVLQLIGVLLIFAGLPVLLAAVYRFATDGRGTPAPIAPTEQLVLGGPNRFVRNPMYLSVVLLIIGQAFLFGNSHVLWYGVLVAAVQALFVRFYEEPALHRRFGADYDRYRAGVPAWIPRRTPWQP